MGVLYILDEPSIGLHQRDNDKLLATLQHLRDLGNTLIVVEHDEDTMRAADYHRRHRPGRGRHTAARLSRRVRRRRSWRTRRVHDGAVPCSGRKKIEVPAVRRPGNGKFLTVRGARENNLKDIDVSVPLGTFTCVTGVSGSGKSSLVNEILYKALGQSSSTASKAHPGRIRQHRGAGATSTRSSASTSRPIGRTPRSNPATYTGRFQRNPQSLRLHAGRQGARLRAGALFVQCRAAAGARPAPATAF